jgi:hypothetical protein
MGGVTDAGSAFSRVESLITVKELKAKYLFGIPLYSFLPDPVTRKRVQYSEETLAEAIRLAVNKLEFMTNIDIQPVQHTKRLPFDRNQYFQLGYFQLPHKPVTEVTSLFVKPAGNTGVVYSIDPAWIDNGQLQRGQVNIIPLMPASVGGFAPLPSAGAGGAAFIAVLGLLGWVPSFWEMTYISGFKEGRVPNVVNNIIGIMAAQDVLGDIGATNRIGQYSVGLDGAQQSVNTGGPNVYKDRIDALEEDRKALTNRLKKKFGVSLFSGSV